jgi:hypothetical protein
VRSKNQKSNTNMSLNGELKVQRIDGPLVTKCHKRGNAKPKERLSVCALPHLLFGWW